MLPFKTSLIKVTRIFLLSVFSACFVDKNSGIEWSTEFCFVFVKKKKLALFRVLIVDFFFIRKIFLIMFLVFSVEFCLAVGKTVQND
jgi:hypothetical protein